MEKVQVKNGTKTLIQPNRTVTPTNGKLCRRTNWTASEKAEDVGEGRFWEDSGMGVCLP